MTDNLTWATTPEARWPQIIAQAQRIRAEALSHYPWSVPASWVEVEQHARDIWIGKAIRAQREALAQKAKP